MDRSDVNGTGTFDLLPCVTEPGVMDTDPSIMPVVTWDGYKLGLAKEMLRPQELTLLQTAQCCICSTVFEKLLMLRNCQHVLCEQDCKKWANESGTCPKCRGDGLGVANLTFIRHLSELVGGIKVRCYDSTDSATYTISTIGKHFARAHKLQPEYKGQANTHKKYYDVTSSREPSSIAGSTCSKIIGAAFTGCKIKKLTTLNAIRPENTSDRVRITGFQMKDCEIEELHDVSNHTQPSAPPFSSRNRQPRPPVQQSRATAPDQASSGITGCVISGGTIRNVTVTNHTNIPDTSSVNITGIVFDGVSVDGGINVSNIISPGVSFSSFSTPDGSCSGFVSDTGQFTIRTAPGISAEMTVPASFNSHSRSENNPNP